MWNDSEMLKSKARDTPKRVTKSICGNEFFYLCQICTLILISYRDLSHLIDSISVNFALHISPIRFDAMPYYIRWIVCFPPNSFAKGTTRKKKI